ncbi:hypothetical protein K1T71_006693 [Dendrolimus kikuchii]|uniref:Uncharacterized protein n=1 Tax=Dendrolimus kikuchii TaxID=765133 RepID=A0ACC1D1X2_9NEOP|nr:hypothetical protein K1T71_006693 [Dendrolimus kikuchii]
MLLKRIIEGKSMLNADVKNKSSEKCSRRKSECDGCVEHSTILEEMMKMVLLGIVLWAGLTFGSHVAPYPLNLILSSTDIVHPMPMYDFPFPSAEMLKRLPQVTVAQTNKSISLSKLEVSLLERLEINLEAAEIIPKFGSAAQGLNIHGCASADAMHYEKSSLIITKASQNLVYTRCRRFGLRSDECASYISTLNLRESEYGGECAALERFTCRTNKMSSKYRTFDGSCNNPVRSSWGQALTGYKRLLHPKYADGISEPRRAVGYNGLPSGRLVSTKLADNLDKPDSTKTIALAVWSQFIFHDLVHTPVRKTIHTNQAIRCCDNSGFDLAPRYVHPSCMPISVPYDDPFYKDSSIACMEYTRSVTTYRGDCTFGASEQMNQATHFLDGSHIYGSNSRDAAALREKTGGLLKTSIIDDEAHLPLVANPTDKCMVESDTAACFNAGDIRVNLHPWLTSLHSIWVREHNRIARALSALNPEWNSDKLYHEARRIVVAELQHITYRHWIPALTGKAFDQLFEGYDTGYNSDVDPTITNSFATAAFHFVNSLLDQDIELVENNNVTSSRLRHNYYKPELVAKKGGVEQALKGMINQNSQRLDFNYDDDLRHHWLGGLDVLAIDIQRGRDHGLPGYTQYRVLCGLPAVTSFQHLADVIPQEVVDKLSMVYEHPNDIDLVVGLMAEKNLPGSLIGPTATYIIKEQLWRSRAGDRYFYLHNDEAGSFSKRQLAEIRRTSLTALLCENGVVANVQKDVFHPPSDSNPIVACEEIKKINLEAWQDPKQQPDILTRTNKWIKNKFDCIIDITEIMSKRKVFAALTLLSVAEALHYNSRPQSEIFRQQPGFQISGPGAEFARIIASTLPAERLPVTGFGPPLAPAGALPSGESQRFSNPPPPLGAGQDPATQTCGLAPPFCTKSRYRSIDGSCNNLRRPAWGMPQTPYGRLSPYNYGDGISSWPVSRTGRPLPNPREISLRLFPDRQLIDPVWNLNTQQWGQIITHDMSLTAGVAQTHKDLLVCCDDNGQLSADAATNPTCAPILIPLNDPVHASQGTQCMNFVRTGTTRDRGCTTPGTAAEPISTVTAFMDLSLVYGSSATQAAPLRAGTGGRLLTVLRGGREWPPQDPNITLTCESAQSPNEPCYLAGDIRANQNPQLTILQIILLREHNRIADTLRNLNPHWNDEVLFQEARRIHIAEIQHINYYEYLPILLGFENMVKNKLIHPKARGYVNDYNPNVDPSVLDEHATAAFRHFHTLIRGHLKMITENRQLVGAVRMSDWFNRPLLLEVNDAFNNLARGLTTQEQDFSDQFWDTEMTQFLFKRNNTFGGDLRATDIQRGRDHGLGSYISTRAACGLPVPNTFEDMLDFISQENVKILQGLYDTADDVELVVAASLERNVPGAQAGPTFLCILTEQFYRTRVSDRYFYENGADPDTAFTPGQLQTIRQGSSMARLMCDNAVGVQSMQPRAFQQISSRNQVVSCEQLPYIDLTLWQDANGRFNSLQLYKMPGLAYLALMLLINVLLISGYTERACNNIVHIDITSENQCGVRKLFCRRSRYRSLDGSCNNLRRPEWGSASMPYRRLLPNVYSDGKKLPNARVMSMEIYPGTDKQDLRHTMITMQWGQVVAHDLSLTMGISQTLQNPISCCKDGKILDPASSSPRCAPIARPPNDPATIQEGDMCIDFARTLTTKDLNCTSDKEPQKPLSSITAYLDLSLTYGLNDSASYTLREGQGGRLMTIKRHGHEWPPQDPNITAGCAVTSANEPCYFAGDIRVNQNIQLSLLQVVLLREHNRIADALKSINPQWNDETLFQEARRILIACAQKITYYEYLPIQLGYENMIREKLIYLNPKGHVNDYKSNEDPSIYTEFSAAAFRFFHTAVNGLLKKYAENRKVIGGIRLSDGNLKPSLLEIHDNFVGLSRGLCTQTQNDYDQFLTPEITNYFFRFNSTFGTDLRAIDIQRSRDFELANYNDTRVHCDLPPIHTFDDLKVIMSAENVKKLEYFYDDVKDIELLVAGSLEYIVPNTTLGPTFLCIILKQFYNTRVADRFFFENGHSRRTAFTTVIRWCLAKKYHPWISACGKKTDKMPRWANLALMLLTNVVIISGYTHSACKKVIDVDISSQNQCGVNKRSCGRTRYRSLDGSCNNHKRPEWGSTSMPYNRLLPNRYSDGVSEFPRSSTGKQLPNARAMSMKIYPGTEKQDFKHTMISMQWGQVIAHDLSLTMGISQTLQNPISCCQDGKILDPASSSPRCKPIARPSDDPATLQEGNMCIDFARTLTTKDLNCTSDKEPERPLSSVTAYLDLSLTYGLNDSASYTLREGHGGRLMTLKRNGHEWPPQDPNITAACAVTSANEPCYYTGDVRVNQNLQLSLLQVVLLREHNRIADALKCINPKWDDEKLYQEARRILIACAQKITYYEYLPDHLGYKNMISRKLIYLNPKGHVNDYNSTVNPSVYAEFSAAAFRFFHTAINGLLKKYTEDRAEIESIRLSDGNVKPSLLELDGNFDGLSRGLCTQTQNDYDEFITSEITNYFFRLNSTYGDDVRAIDIQRSRDFRLANYNDTRVYCGLSPIYTFDDLKVNISSKNVEKLKYFYDDVKDVELLVAGSLEYIVPGTTLGPTFLCIILKQFYNTRVADRFFFENGHSKRIAFTTAQLRSIHEMSLARIMCDNTGITQIQRRVFRVISEDNPLVPCETIPSLDLSLWKEKC